MKIHRLTTADAFASLKSGMEGLSDVEAQRRLAEFGKNEVEEVAHEPLLLTFAREFVHFFALILWVAAGLAFFAEWREPGQGMATLGFAIIGVILMNGVFSFWQAYRAEQALEVLKKLLPSATKVVRGGTVHQLPAADLVPGDVILLEAGDILPADCRLVEAFSVRVNNSTVTGESLPVSRDAEPCDETERDRRGAEEGVAPGRVVDQQDERDLGGDAGDDEFVAEKAERECGAAVAAAEEDVRDLHDHDGAETGGRGLKIERVVSG